jgi:hypothetical protein
MKNILLVFACAVVLGMQAQQTAEEQIKETISTFFDGLHQGDTTIIAKTVHPDLKLQTTGVNREGEKMLRSQTKASFFNGVASKNPEDKWFEKILSYKILVDGPMAVAWTPYEFYRNDNFSHCGVNAFTLFDDNGTWQIINLIDTRKREGCQKME